MEMIYRKVGRKYVPIELFTGFPADGIWLHVTPPTGHQSSLVLKLADLNGIDARLAAEIAKLQPVIMDALLDPTSLCIMDRANHIVLALTKYLQKGEHSDCRTNQD